MSDPAEPQLLEEAREDLPTTELVVTRCAANRTVIRIANQCLDEDRFIRLIGEGDDVLKVIRIVDKIRAMRNGGVLQQTRTSFPSDRAMIHPLSAHERGGGDSPTDNHACARDWASVWQATRIGP